VGNNIGGTYYDWLELSYI